jgi:Domain of unknown function (DUF4160)
MPVVFRIQGWRFHFYSYEGSPREPIHIHVAKAGKDAKLWLYPEVKIAYDQGLNAKELALVLRLVAENSVQIEEAWNVHFANTN